jgi:succinyl-CoA synthetase beta subunit
VPIAPHELVHDAIAAGRAAEAVSFPVVLKLQSPDLPHRAAVGAVRFGIGSVEQAELAYEELMQVITRMDREVEVQGVLVQRQVTAVGPEILVGTTLDAAFGPVTSVGVGGMHAETSTPSIRRAPVSPEAASETVDTLVHGLPASLRATMEVQREALVAAIVALSAVGCQAIASGEMTEFEVNPLVLTAEGPVIVDALGIDRSARP